MPVAVHLFLPASFFSSFSKLASSQDSPVVFLMRGSGPLRQTSPGSPLSICPKPRAGVSSEGAARKGMTLPSLLDVGRTQPTPALRLFAADPAQLPSENLVCWVLDNYHWRDWAFRLFWEAICNTVARAMKVLQPIQPIGILLSP